MFLQGHHSFSKNPKLMSEGSQASVLLPHWNSKEFVAFPVITSVAPGVRFSVLGSSGTLLRKQSSTSLNWSRLQLFIFLRFLGRAFHNFGCFPVKSNHGKLGFPGQKAQQSICPQKKLLTNEKNKQSNVQSCHFLFRNQWPVTGLINVFVVTTRTDLFSILYSWSWK